MSSETVTTDAGPAPGGGLRARPADGTTFAGGDPAAAAGRTVTGHSPPRCPARTRAYRGGRLIDEGFPVAELSDHLDTHPDTFVWLDLHDADTGDLEVITEEFGLHPLAVEDAVNEHQRPKVDRYDDHLFLSAYAVRLDAGTGRLAASEIAAFITPRALITVRKDDGFDPEALVGRWDASPDLAAHGVGFLLHGLLDQVVDGHFTAVQSLDDEIEELQDQLFAEVDPGQALQQRSFELRKSLVLLRRVVLPMREVVNTLMRRDLHLLDEALTPYYQDVYDHVLRATEWTESLRDLVTTILETRLTIQGNRLNEIMRKLTCWAAIIAVPTAVTGFYGQNVPYPGFQQSWGFVTSIVLMLVIGGGIYLGFKRRKWV
ncbi:magnesium transporter CorA family protein [Actinomycetospora sp. TBRC 11914]|uniref:magnesium transporter CorA family protein n=1 Tax=Actinomycetospora sp. TBRC 11914 TaxID=2729387 RepID=UPI00145F5297|nr:magnesium transporter CorA family protein [Actinomycetospora sp. TBRC 11914]NMO93530.1 magnesium transporter CorA family protein [Actinomycetospora sp. TBRC 11914]